MNIFDEMMTILNAFYDAAKKNPTIEKPLSYALCKTWIEIDRLEKPRKEAVEELPSVTPQQRTGHWRKVSMDKYIQHATYYYECSECGDQHIGQVNYCPNCGCKMEVEE